MDKKKFFFILFVSYILTFLSFTMSNFVYGIPFNIKYILGFTSCYLLLVVIFILSYN